MWRGIIFFSIMFAHTATHAGFLAPMEFPKTAADLSFVDRMALNAAGYEPYESEYDENGKCISGCAYVLPNIEEEIAAMERRNAMVRQELMDDYGYTENEDGDLTPPDEYMPPVSGPDAPDAPDISETPFPDDTQTKKCAVHNPKFKNTNLPSGSPLGYITCITSDYGVQRKLSWNKTTKIHYGIDLAVNTGTPIYAPANGTIETVFNMNRTCGNGIIIKHPSGYTTQYCHLSKVSVSRGESVSAGCLIGYTGNTGLSTGPHLHYAVKKDGHAVDPKNFIEPGHKMCH